MKIKAFFLFPTTEDDILRIGDNPNEYALLIDEVAIIKEQLRNHKEFELCYDSKNVDSFLNHAEKLITTEYIAGCRNQIRILFGNHSRNVSETPFKKTDCIYVNWKIDPLVELSNDILSEAAESLSEKSADKTILINIAQSYPTNRHDAHVIKDAKHVNGLPLLITIPIAHNEIEFAEWYTTISNPEFSLRDKNRFEITTFR